MDQARETGAHLVWRIKKDQVRPCLKRLKDGPCLGTIYPSDTDRRHGAKGMTIRVIEYALEGVEDAEPLYRIATSILNPDTAPAHEPAILYHERHTGYGPAENRRATE